MFISVWNGIVSLSLYMNRVSGVLRHLRAVAGRLKYRKSDLPHSCPLRKGSANIFQGALIYNNVVGNNQESVFISSCS